ncbi:MAG TPA: tripartite tricarboxylate transporter TctB family protein [Candidatus Sphingobacterium stercoripullorum]|nr:tripartite tricarboxylate transporter TctB family protein [Candidatus Sphingobacterium stercoripullorum]
MAAQAATLILLVEELMDRHRLYSAALPIILGIGAVFNSKGYALGTLSNMGPGYYPILLGYLLIGLGLLVAIVPTVETQKNRKPLRESIALHLRAWVAIVGGMILFIVLGQYTGLVIATFTLIFVAALGDRNNSLKACFWLAVAVVVFSVVVFHYGMQMQFPLFIT